MPVLEAMASGLAVVATNCLGVNSFAQHSVNALLADPQVLIVATSPRCCGTWPHQSCTSSDATRTGVASAVWAVVLRELLPVSLKNGTRVQQATCEQPHVPAGCCWHHQVSAGRHDR